MIPSCGPGGLDFAGLEDSEEISCSMQWKLCEEIWQFI